MQKLIVISAPSGAGKTSIVHYVLKKNNDISFSVSACSRDKRGNEFDGKDYYFLGEKAFKQKIDEDAFLEWEQVYENQYYGTLKSEIERIWSNKKVVIFDIDVVGGINIKSKYPKECLSIFIMPPSIDELRNRLSKRATETNIKIEIRLSKAKREISKSKEFDHVILNDNFEVACNEVNNLINKFIHS